MGEGRAGQESSASDERMKPPRPRESGDGGGNTSVNRTQFADDVVEPLLNKDAITVATVANSDTESLDSDNVRYKPTNAQLFRAGVVLAVSSAGVAASVASFILSPEIFVYIAGGICCLHFPFVVYRERKILKLPGESFCLGTSQDDCLPVTSADAIESSPKDRQRVEGERRCT